MRSFKLSHNKIPRLSAEQLPPLIEKLNLSHNLLDGISKATFSYKSYIRSLDLRSNRIAIIPEGVFEQALLNQNSIQIWLGGNPLSCNCEMSWLVGLSQRKREGLNQIPAIEIVDISESECSLPRSDETRKLGDAKADDFLCRYDSFCEENCICCQYGSCDCKSKCPDGCSCFRDARNNTNVVVCDTPAELSIHNIPMPASHILLTGMNMSTLHTSDFFGRGRLMELHINSSGVERIEPNTFNSLPKLKVVWRFLMPS